MTRILWRSRSLVRLMPAAQKEPRPDLPDTPAHRGFISVAPTALPSSRLAHDRLSPPDSPVAVDLNKTLPATAAAAAALAALDPVPAASAAAAAAESPVTHEYDHFHFHYESDSSNPPSPYRPDSSIGMAIGSPTNSSSAAWSQTPRSTSSLGSHNASNPQYSAIVESTSQPKLSRWKSLFGKRTPAAAAVAASPSSTRSPVGPQPLQRSFTSNPRMEGSVESFRSRASPFRSDANGEQPTGKRRVVPKPEPVDTDVAQSPASYTARSTRSPAPPPKDSPAKIPTFNFFPSTSPLKPTNAGLSPTSSSSVTPLLDVDIPRIEMERYSVMFSSLLTQNRASNLLARRQGATDKLKPLDEVALRKGHEESLDKNGLQRRATTPTARSPAFSLFPKVEQATPSPASIHPARKTRPRSNTAPGALSPGLPPREEFPPRLSSKATAAVATAQSASSTSSSHLSTKTPQLQSEGFILSPSPSSSRLSFEDSGDEITVMISPSHVPDWRPQEEEPVWEMITKPLVQEPVPPLPVSRPQRLTLKDVQQRKPSQKQQLPNPQPRPKRSATNPSKSAKPAVEVVQFSTARSISVSRRKPQLLNAQAATPPDLIRLHQEERLEPKRYVERPVHTPTIVQAELLRNSHSVQVMSS